MNTTNLDRDAARHTAHNTFAELIASCQAGYTPSLRRSWAAQRRLGEALVLRGLAVYWG